MRVAIGSYLSDGTRRTLRPGFRPLQFFAKADAAQHLAQRSADSWCARTNVLSASDSFLDGVGFFGEEIVLGASATVNSNNVRYYWCAIGDDGSADVEVVSYMGNATAGHQLQLKQPKQPIAMVTKRDSTAPAVIKIPGVASVTATGSAVAECFGTISAGTVALNNVVNVNEYDSAGGLGEGIDMLALYDGGNAKVVSWTNAASGAVIDAGCDPLAALIFRVDAIGTVAHFVTRDMQSAAPIDNSAGLPADPSNYTATLVAGGIQLGPLATLRTGTFYAILFGRKDTAAKITPPAIVVRERRGVYLPGRGVAAQVDCGTSDATLKIDGPITLEWFGIVWPDQYNVNAGVHLLERGVGPAATAGAYSWGLAGVQAQDFSWSGPQLACLTTNRWAEAAPLDSAVWRTGIVMPYGQPFMFQQVHTGNGRHLALLNGQLVKQRNIPLATNIASGAGHRTAMGMRRNTADTAWTQAQRMVILSARVYAAALTPEQCAKRFAREVMGSSESDVTTGLAEWWDARNASGLLLPAQVNAANNGALSASARVITL